MNETLNIHKLFRNSRDIAADNAIIAAMPHVSAELQRRLVGILFAHGSDDSLATIPDFYHLLDESVTTEVIANTALLFGSLRTTSRSPTIQTRLNSIEIIRRSLNPRLAYLAAIALNDGAVQIRAEASATLRQLTTHHCRTHHETAAILREVAPQPDSAGTTEDRQLAHSIVQTLQLIRDERQHLLEALREAILHFDMHHRLEVLEAAMLLADELESGLFHENSLKRGKITKAMIDLFSANCAPEMAPFVYIALCYPEPRRRVLATLANSQNDGFFAEFIRWQWMAREPKIRRGLAFVRSIAWLTDPMQSAFSLPADAAALAPNWLLSLGIPTDQKINLLQQFLLIDNPAANRAAAWALIHLKVPASSVALQQLLDHEEPGLRRIAQRELDHRRRVDDRLLPSRLNRPEGWTRLLLRAGIEEDFENLWNRFDQLDPREARTSGPGALRYISGFSTQIQVRLIGNLPADRLRAVRLIIALNVVSEFARTLFNMANDSNTEVRAATMTALGRLHDQTACRILERALADDEPSVQVAAIEAFEDVNDRRRIELIAPRCDSSNASVRAASVRFMLRMQQPRGASEVLKMMVDPRPDHRCHALWIVDQLNLTPLRSRIAEMNQNDPDPRIARIAHHVARRLARSANSDNAAAARYAGESTPLEGALAGSQQTNTAKETDASQADGIEPAKPLRGPRPSGVSEQGGQL